VAVAWAVGDSAAGVVVAGSARVAAATLAEAEPRAAGEHEQTAAHFQTPLDGPI